MFMTRLVIWLAIAWAVAMAMSFLMPAVTEPVARGFLVGMNLLVIWASWQAGALVLAMILLIVRLGAGSALTSRYRALALVPIMVSGLVVGFAVLVVATGG